MFSIYYRHASGSLPTFYFWFVLFSRFFLRTKVNIKELLKISISCQGTLWAFFKNLYRISRSKGIIFWNLSLEKAGKKVILKEQKLITWSLCFNQQVSKIKIHTVWSLTFSKSSNSNFKWKPYSWSAIWALKYHCMRYIYLHIEELFLRTSILHMKISKL